MTEPSKRRSPAGAPHTEQGSQKKQQRQFTTITREIAAILAIGAMTGVMFWSAVFGAADDLASGPVAPMSYSVAEVTNGH